MNISILPSCSCSREWVCCSKSGAVGPRKVRVNSSIFGELFLSETSRSLSLSELPPEIETVKSVFNCSEKILLSSCSNGSILRRLCCLSRAENHGQRFRYSTQIWFLYRTPRNQLTKRLKMTTANSSSLPDEFAVLKLCDRIPASTTEPGA